MLKNILAATVVVSSSFNAYAKESKRKPAAYERPPQFVLLAFDGSSNLQMWKDTVDFASGVKTIGIDGNESTIKFTYFVNPVYYTEKKYSSVYIAPSTNSAKSCIGWAAPEGSVAERLAATTKAFNAGHEIASHANSHCAADASDHVFKAPWGQSEWESEFSQFNKLLFGAYEINKIPMKEMPFSQKDIIGFRAPLLATTPGLWGALKTFNFKYDTSQIDKPTYWPVKANFSEKWNWGGWNIPLANIKVANSARRTLSMDYNWFVFQTAGESLTSEHNCLHNADYKKNKWCKAGIYMTPEKKAELQEQMVASYKYYFKKNYFGTRAPVQIGHHFSRWNDSAYWDGMKEFATFVCGMPEVRCVTMREYVGWLEGLAAEELNAYRKGDFSPLPDTNIIQDIATDNIPLAKVSFEKNMFTVGTKNKTTSFEKSLKLTRRLSVDFKPVVGQSIKLSDIKAEKGDTVFVRASLVSQSGKEVSWETLKVTDFGTNKQVVSKETVEEMAQQGETIDAHTGPEAQ